MLEVLIMGGGVGQLGVLIASALVPSRLNWKKELRSLPKLHRQMYWVYGGYVVLAITAFGLISLFNARELSSGTGLARGLCAYISLFWGGRLLLQGVFDVKGHLTTRWLKLGYHTLTLLFIALTLIYGFAALRASPDSQEPETQSQGSGVSCSLVHFPESSRRCLMPADL